MYIAVNSSGYFYDAAGKVYDLPDGYQTNKHQLIKLYANGFVEWMLYEQYWKPYDVSVDNEENILVIGRRTHNSPRKTL